MKFPLPQIKEVKPEIVGFINKGRAYLDKSRFTPPQWSVDLQQQVSEVGSGLSEELVSSGKKFAGKTMGVLNPGSSYLSPQLERRGINPTIAGAIGLGVDILTPGPGEIPFIKPKEEDKEKAVKARKITGIKSIFSSDAKIRKELAESKKTIDLYLKRLKLRDDELAKIKSDLKKALYED